MIIRRFLAWTRTAPAEPRAAATGALARAYLTADMDAHAKAEAEAALTLALDDPSPLVRAALADALAGEAGAPRHLVAALASDAPEIAALILERSPLLSDPELIDHAAMGSAATQAAIARRADLSPAVAAALAEVAEADAVLALVSNAGAVIPTFSLERMIERFGGDADLRRALLERPDLTIGVRLSALLAGVRAPGADAASRDGLSPARCEQLQRDEEEKIVLALAARSDDDELTGLVAHLRAAGRLTPGLLLRGLLFGEQRLVAEAVANLVRLPARRVAALMAEPRSGGWRALHRKAGLPQLLLGAFQSAIEAARAEAGNDGWSGGPALARRVIGRVIADCVAMGEDTGGRVLVLLRRFEVDIARDEARWAADAMLASMAQESASALAIAAPANADPAAESADPFGALGATAANDGPAEPDFLDASESPQPSEHAAPDGAVLENGSDAEPQAPRTGRAILEDDPDFKAFFAKVRAELVAKAA
ncbi:DUF2336 domain-containing protein [Alsobacter sp. KACC 23698]|uniref:DUF2336 domain-containing protein n=1 Tax=Alsobacter sp. KACC 23698 TaxID=3149229 RepID=A0AAU7JA20_9HYPH